MSFVSHIIKQNLIGTGNITMLIVVFMHVPHISIPRDNSTN